MPTPVLAADVKALAEELTTVLDAKVNLYIELAKLQVLESFWGAKYKMGVVTLAAHLLTLMNRAGGSAGSVSSEAVGELSISYSAPTSDSELGTTTYGSMYIALRKTLNITPLVV